MLLLLVLGCNKTTPAAKPVDLQPGDPVPAQKTVVPAEHERLHSLLQAWHAEDLPDRDALVTNGAPESLVWIADNDAMLVIRERALLLLQHFPNDNATCRQVFGDPAQHAKLRAASIRCLASVDLMADATLRNQMLGALRDEDPRVGTAAVQVLAEVPAAASGLKAALDDQTIQGQVREELEQAVK